ncbi:MAG TPA: MucB/RseB C-terminal domain-containing protein, partial [Halothiobacillus sp.]|nr:MucB/RseB C-terminal domain-containing protein [Halothiobacillus sp.]
GVLNMSLLKVGLLAVSLLATVGNAQADSWQFNTFSVHLLQVSDPQAQGEPSLETVMDWLAQMTQAMRQTDYAGTYVHIRGDQVDTTRLLHRFTPKGEQEQLETLNGDPHSVVRHGDSCECQWPLRKEVVFGDFPSVRSRLSGERFAHPAELTANYQIVSLGSSRVAGFSCHLVGLVPRDGLRYGYKLCVADQSHLLLRMSMYNEQGLPIEHDFFTAIEPRTASATASDSPEWPEIPLGSPQSIPPGFNVVEQPPSMPPKPLAADEGWVVSPDLPGYTIQSRVWRQNPVTHHPFEHMVVSDGLSTASVFIEKMPEPKALDPEAAKYGMNIAVRQVGPVRLTVIGDLPMAAVEQICQNTVLIKNSATERAEQNPLHMPNTEAR